MTPLNDGLLDIEAVKQIIKDKHVERNELYIGSEPIPYQITEKVNMRVDVLYELLLPILNQTPSESVRGLDIELAPFVNKRMIYTTPDYSKCKEASYVIIDKEFLFDMFDDLLVQKTKEE